MKNVSAFLFSLLAWFSGPSALANDTKRQVIVTTALAKSYVDRAHALKLSERNEWHRLLHYRNGLFGWTSEADGMNFFVAPNGKHDPRSELEATILGFFSPEKRKLAGDRQPPQSVRCQFPARFAWLDSQLQLSAIAPSDDCREWNEFRERMAVKSVTLVFSSFYVGNPSSTYGHSLIRLNKSDGAEGSEHHQLLDFGVNYAALATTDNQLLYSLFGLSGVFEGHFTSLPYYYKVREYGDFESRDLWEYDLNLSSAETSQVVAHIWELGSTYFDYYYLTENCSYHMMTLLEAAAPRLNLVDKTPYFVIPTDTIKATFEEPGLVSKTSFRASIYSQFRARLALLDDDERAQLRGVLHDPSSSPSVLNPKVLDTYIDYFDLNHAHELLSKDASTVLEKQKILIARSKLATLPPLSFNPPPKASPHLAHDSARIGASRASNDVKGNATELSFRFAFHDLVDPPEGLPENADIEMGTFTFRLWDNTSRVQLEDMALFGVGTYQLIDEFTRKPSWRIRTGAHRVDDLRCRDCDVGYFKGGWGASIGIGEHGTIAYLLGEANLETSPRFEPEKLTTSYGPTLGLRFMVKPWISALIEGRYIRNANLPGIEDRQLDGNLRFYPNVYQVSWAIDGHISYEKANREVSVGLLHYF